MPDPLYQTLLEFHYSSHIFAAILFLAAAALHSPTRHGWLPGRSVQNAALVTGLIHLLLPLHVLLGWPSELAAALEVMMLYCWIYSLLKLLEAVTGRQVPRLVRLVPAVLALVAMGIALAATFPLPETPLLAVLEPEAKLAPLLLCIVILILLEQLFRNADSSGRHQLKFIGIGLLSLTSFELYCFAYTNQFGGLEASYSQARGSVHLIAAIIIGLGALRSTPGSGFAISRTMTLYSTSILLAGIFLLIMALAGYYLQLRGDNWAEALQLVLMIFSVSALITLFSSRRSRANLQVFISKHFFRHKYDYRHVWLNLIHTLSEPIVEGDFMTRAIKATANVFDSPGGVLWLKNDSGYYETVADWNMPFDKTIQQPADCEFINLLWQHEWVFAPGSHNNPSFDTENGHLPEWSTHTPSLWIIAPLLIANELTGFYMLAKPANSQNLIWEDLDVLKTVGRQLASHIVRQKSAEQLAEAKQFDTYNRLTAFIMHDLKNLIAQQALVVKNANKHKENPAFVEDAINTIDNSVQRMSYLLKRLQSSSKGSNQKSVSIEKVLQETIRKATDRQPIPTLRSEATNAKVVTDREELIMVLMHVIRNAQDATDTSGFIDVALRAENDEVMIEVEDNGCGMNKEFVKNRLFKPFESTKSSQGMGIGAYQVREFIQNMGGDVQVDSAPDVGTTVLITLPAAS